MIALILGGGAGSRLFPLTEKRSKPAVSIGGKYRLIDIPISNCLNSDVRKIFILTQYNSASLNQHIKNTFTFDNFSNGFIDILAAEQTPGNNNWFQGTADAVRQSMKHLKNQLHFESQAQKKQAWKQTHYNRTNIEAKQLKRKQLMIKTKHVLM